MKNKNLLLSSSLRTAQIGDFLCCLLAQELLQEQVHAQTFWHG